MSEVLIKNEPWQYKAKNAISCPYCGGESVSVKHKEVRFYGFNGLGFKKHRMKAYCVCNKCGATGTPIYYDGYSNAGYGFYDKEHLPTYSCGEEAIKSWNTRKPMEQIVERLEEKLSDTVYEKATQEVNESYMDGLSVGFADAIYIVKAEGLN